MQKSPRGSWVDIEIDDGRRAYGELLAIDTVAQMAYLEMRGTLARVPRARIQHIELTFYDGQEGAVALWGLTGTVSTISHGLVLIFSAPAWLLTTGITAGLESSAGTISARAGGSLTAEKFASLRKYARFPQGLPAGFTVQPASAPMPPPMPAVPSDAPPAAPTQPAQPADTAPMPPPLPAPPADTAPAPPSPLPADTAPARPAPPTAMPGSQPPGR